MASLTLRFVNFCWLMLRLRYLLSFGVLYRPGLFAVLEAVENLTVALCKHQKWKEQVKISKCRVKIWEFNIENCGTDKIFKN